jgi:hypothetical protein
MRITVILIIFLAACNPYKTLRKQTVNVEGNTIDVLVPRRYNKSEQKKDELGNQVQFFHYGDGAYLFFAKRGAGTMFPIDTSNHIGRVQPNGGLFYKQLTDKNEYSRDVIYNDFWFGYRRAAPGTQEALFDSSMNYVKVK